MKKVSMKDIAKELNTSITTVSFVINGKSEEMGISPVTAKKVRDHCIVDAKYANAIRWQPAFKQLIYRNDEGKLIVTISQNSIGNAITELLGVVVNRAPDADAYAKHEPALIERLLEVRRRLIEADLGEGIATDYWAKD